MPITTIHPDFKLNDHLFDSISDLLDYLKDESKHSYDFLVNWFDDSPTITVTTSGSTGKPKEINISKQAMLHSAEATGKFFNLASGTKALHCLSPDFIAGKMMWVRALHLGWHLNVVTVDPNPLKHTKNSYDFVAMVPLQVKNSIQELSRVKTLIIGGAPLSASLEKELHDMLVKAYQTYGMTETITHIAVKKISKENTNYVCLPGITVSTDERDCLVIDSPRISEIPVVTNDVVSVISKNEFDWLGRYDNVINSGGVKIFPEKVERKLHKHIQYPFFISNIPDDKLGQKVVLIIEGKSEIKREIEHILDVADLDKFEKPKQIYTLNSFVRTDNAKVNRKQSTLLI